MSPACQKAVSKSSQRSAVRRAARTEKERMIVQVQTLARSRPIMTSFTTMSA